MKLSRGLTLRILAVALLVGGVSATLGFLESVNAQRDVLTAWLADRWRDGLREEVGAACLRDPSGFAQRDGNNLHFEALDVRTGRSANPATAPEDPDLLRDLGDVPERRGGPRARLVTFVRGVGSGPCSAIRITLRVPDEVRAAAIEHVAVAVLSIVLAAALFVWSIVVAPLRRRIARVRSAAWSVGADDYRNQEEHARDELGDVARAIAAAHRRIERDRDALVESHRALERFLEDIAHDLRTPLTSMRLALEELDDLELPPEADEVLRAAIHDAVYASSLTDNLKLASRLEHGPDPLAAETVFDMTELAERVALRERGFARRSGMRLETRLPDRAVEVSADALMVEQAITNLVQNAIIHGEEGGRVEIELRADAGGFVWEVADDGPGVPPEAIPRLGERAFRSDEARARNPDGSGLGLAIASEVCDRFGWTLSFAGRAPRGLRATIRGATSARGTTNVSSSPSMRTV
ncbi:MAG TPA: HAMP domain-containing sensor histidine kinase [Sandaracinaceae bacterium LLY-WYZ-13_1]|nr:HAMP domain-containing sensor histidine kinase [Sandaracinaceae bacterium LLY-WYZ-13_1]